MGLVRLVVAALWVQTAFADDGTDGGTYCDSCGSGASYAETISEYGSTGHYRRTINYGGCPNHYAQCHGMRMSGVTVTINGEVKGNRCAVNSGNEGHGTAARPQDKSEDVPAYPVIANINGNVNVKCSGGPIAIALNGIPFYSRSVGGCDELDVTDSDAEWVSFDLCGGHADANVGQYHYHFPPQCLLSQIGDLSDGHSPQIGWSFDGFPVYGPKGPNGVEMLPCTDSGADSTYCMDTCGGMYMEISGLDDFKYRYYVSGNVGDEVSMPSNPKPETKHAPFTMDCYVGCTFAKLRRGRCSGDAGYTSSYTPVATTGVTDQYYPAAASDSDWPWEYCANPNPVVPSPTASPTTVEPTMSPDTSQPTPTPANYISASGKCFGGSGYLGTCVDGYECYIKNQYYGQCRTSCPNNNAWACNTDAPTVAPTSCTNNWGNCKTGPSHCCSSDYACYVKSSTYSQCRKSCPSNSAWECHTSNDDTQVGSTSVYIGMAVGAFFLITGASYFFFNHGHKRGTASKKPEYRTRTGPHVKMQEMPTTLSPIGDEL